MRTPLYKLVGGCLLALASPLAMAVTDAQIFSWAAFQYPQAFSGAVTGGQYLQYNYRVYGNTGYSFTGQ